MVPDDRNQGVHQHPAADGGQAGPSPKRLDPARAQHAVAPAVRTHQGGMFGLFTLLVAMGFGLFVIGPLVVMGIVEAPPLLLVALVLAIACALILRGIARQHAGLMISSHGVRGDAFARLVQQARFECPLCDYDLAGLHDDQCPECGYRLELVVRVQPDPSTVVPDGPGISRRDMAGPSPRRTRRLGWCLLAGMILATATPAVVVLVRDARPPILAGGCLVIVAIWTAMWARQDFERMLPGSRREQLWSMAVLGPIIALIALVDLAV